MTFIPARLDCGRCRRDTRIHSAEPAAAAGAPHRRRIRSYKGRLSSRKTPRRPALSSSRARCVSHDAGSLTGKTLSDIKRQQDEASKRTRSWPIT